MARPTPLSGFPEWLPEQRIVEQTVVDRLRQTFEAWGYASIETRAAEPLDQLLRKGEIDKEVYVLRRLHAEQGDADAGLGLHFDLTVPLARYVLEHGGHLNFPFKRYQIQKVWRGERPQEGRYREFLQADIDVIDVDSLSFHFEVEVAQVMSEAFAGLPLPALRMQVNNRNLIEGFYRGVGVADIAGVMRVVDKLDKLAPEAIRDLLETEANVTGAAADLVLAFAAISAEDSSFADAVTALGISDPQLDQGLDELVRVIDGTAPLRSGRFSVIADLRIARGLDYYTGTVYETRMAGFDSLGSVCSGGRYDSLASDGSTTYPGVGISFGVTRTLAPLFSRGVIRASRSVPTCVVVAVADEESRSESDSIARALRARGIPVEVSPSASKFGKQIRYADRRGIPFVWFADADGTSSVKDIRSGEQVPADATTWQPPTADLRPHLVVEGD
ncbi:MAG: histidine--tRNA ligase [Actinomycetes bacterium]